MNTFTTYTTVLDNNNLLAPTVTTVNRSYSLSPVNRVVRTTSHCSPSYRITSVSYSNPVEYIAPVTTTYYSESVEAPSVSQVGSLGYSSVVGRSVYY